MMYNKVVEDCFFHPEHVGVLEATDPWVAHYSYKMMHQNTMSMIDLYMQCSREGLIRKACFKSNGNPYILAALEWLCQNIEGTNLDSAPSINYQMLINVLGIPNNQYPVALVIEDVYKETLALMQKNMGYKS